MLVDPIIFEIQHCRAGQGECEYRYVAFADGCEAHGTTPACQRCTSFCQAFAQVSELGNQFAVGLMPVLRISCHHPANETAHGLRDLWISLRGRLVIGFDVHIGRCRGAITNKGQHLSLIHI